MGFDAKNGPAGAPGDAREGSGTSLEGGFRKSLKKTPESDAWGNTIWSTLGTLTRLLDAFRAKTLIHGCFCSHVLLRVDFRFGFALMFKGFW